MDLKTEITAAETRIRPYVRETPVDESPALGQAAGARVLLKMEHLQLTGSFKLRGAMNRLLSLTPDEKAEGIVTASSGNHGAAVAYGLKALGCPGVIFVPENASPAKVANIRAYGAEVRTHATDSGITEMFARRHAQETARVYVSPYNDPLVVAGQGTIGAELARQVDRIDALFVALGGGGLISGIAGYLKSGGAPVEVIACSPENSAVMHHSVAAGRILEMESKPTLSDGTAGAVEPGAITLDLCRRFVDRYVLVSETEIRDAMRLVIDRHHTLIEGAAGVAVAGFLKEKERFAGRSVVIVLCGANISRDRLKDVL
ncbi:MAG TPA: threonine/serine dehydratase [Candidatus Polarisedimenticolia bacterium]|jgi:threonine dehydratase|nr:threonine/serine dehydratase [Candidatus Polarisedimenticolia bacterium]